MSLPPILFYPGAGRKLRSQAPILNSDGVDIRKVLADAATAGGIPLRLALACITAESDLNPRAERWGRNTVEARKALAAGDRATLQTIVDRAWPDVSFGYGQRIVAFHYVGDGSKGIKNVLAVREHVFANPEQDLEEMARKLAHCRRVARAADLSLVGGDELLGALVVYNAGHFPAAGASYWRSHQQNVERYRRALDAARSLASD